ncbi:MAG TPA: sensor domain-containing diguanylate cyclase [Pyrinomonadaceae bacterium]|nr:sensor domain-containing diguanylate cyclase [Pyrinomonadaceae bacterium]
MDHTDRTGGSAFRLFAVFGFAAPLITFVVAISGLSAEAKIIVLASVAFSYAALAFWAHRKQTASSAVADQDLSLNLHADEPVDVIGDRLAALDEASRFFGASLNKADMFRLVSARVGEIFPISAAALFVADAARDALTVAAADGKISHLLEDREFKFENCLAGMAWLSGEIEVDRDLRMERNVVGLKASEHFGSAIALPLINEERPFAVFEIFTREKIENQEAALETLEAIRTRITPLILGSFAVDRSLSNALTDSITELPNERALYVVLENQLAESIRSQDERPLSVVAIDIRNFDEANRQFGHATGDRILKFVAELIRQPLRKMDFLARSTNDEFLLVLPTANEQTALTIIERVQKTLAENAFSLAEEEKIAIRLNFGLASYWKDGDTPQQLVRHAQLRKDQAKAEDPDNVAWFPKEYVH